MTLELILVYQLNGRIINTKNAKTGPPILALYPVLLLRKWKRQSAIDVIVTVQELAPPIDICRTISSANLCPN